MFSTERTCESKAKLLFSIKLVNSALSPALIICNKLLKYQLILFANTYYILHWTIEMFHVIMVKL